jgi:hypothetical protein
MLEPTKPEMIATLVETATSRPLRLRRASVLSAHSTACVVHTEYSPPVIERSACGYRCSFNGGKVTSSNTSNTTTDDHHPEHSFDSGAMGSCCDHNTLVLSVRRLKRIQYQDVLTYEYKEQRGQNDTDPATEAIDAKPKEEHTKDVSDQDRV